MKNIVVIVIGALLLGVLFWFMKPAPPAPVSAPPTPAAIASSPAPVPAAALATPAVPAPQVFELVVKDKKLLSGPAVISVPEGTAVTLRITTDHHDELHLHGYDLSLQLPPNIPTELHFVADRSGRFEYELHHAHLELGALEVQPQ